jgi:CubicO group peptidase (beta-lactamase class C family)
MSPGLSQAGLDRLRAGLAAHIERKELPGLVALVALAEEVHVDAIGTKAFDGGEPMRRETLFRVASMTKPIVAAATLMLLEEGKLGLDDPVDRWLPELANLQVLRHVDGLLGDTVAARRKVTVDDLLTLRMGNGMLTEPSFDPPFPIVNAANDLQLVLNQPDPRTPHTPDEWIKRFGSLPLMYQPGERWQYNVGSLVLGVLVARAAGQQLGDVLQERIFDPLGMSSTGFHLPLQRTRGLPAYYSTDFASGQLQQRDVSTPEEWSRPPAFPSGAGGLVSTADDYLAFARCLLNNGEYRGHRLLSAKSVETMTSNHLSREQVATAGVILGGRSWGFGVGVVTAPDAEWPVPGRYGWSGGYGTTWFNDPHLGVAAILLTQTSDVMWNGTIAEFDKLVAGCVS